MSFTHYKQLDAMDCGPTCLRMIAKYWGKNLNLQDIRIRTGINRDGVSLLGICKAAESFGFKTLPVRATFSQLEEDVILPAIIHWEQNHFVVIYKISRGYIYIADPSKGKLKYTRNEFRSHWEYYKSQNESSGVVLILEPTNSFYEIEDGKDNEINAGRLIKYIFKQKILFVQLAISLFLGSILQLLFPFFTQSIVDVGISSKDLDFIYLILFAQLALYIGNTIVDFMRSWILLHISTRINLSLLSDFLIKLLKLPLSFFDGKMIGDILQRMSDHQRIETFLTQSTLNFAFSFLNFIIFSFVIILYNIKIFLIFLVGSLIYLFWILLFLKIRRKYDYLRFELEANNQNNTLQLLHGMHEIKLNNCEQSKRWKWERIQSKLYKLNVKSLTINQVQQSGAVFINQSKNILVTFLSAKAVIEGSISLGGMLAIQFILGQLNSPIQQFIQFVQSFQDAKISLERINDIHKLDEEEPVNKSFIDKIPSFASISFNEVSFKYEGMDNDYILKSLNFEIPYGKTTAIVGISGSGKTTLLKLLLKFYEVGVGQIKVDNMNLNNIRTSIWRSKCGVVMQEGYIFSDTIANNITVSDEDIDYEKLNYAIEVANIQDFIDSLPFGYNTKIGTDGSGISQGQKQRVLIARAVYKDPQFIFLDEATNSLDANNEVTIMENLKTFLQNRTVIVVAHRLSTVKNADQIIVLHKGQIQEMGSHDYLINKRGSYYKLVKDQLELDN